MRMFHHAEQVRPLSPADSAPLLRLLNTSEYVYQRFTVEELGHILADYPAVGLFHGTGLRSFLLSETVNPPSAWIGGFGVTWSESRAALRFLDLQLEYLEDALRTRGVENLYYSGNDQENDWLRGPLLNRRFIPFRRLYAYDKFDYAIPTEGNQEVRLRKARTQDIPTLLELDKRCFEQLWCYDVASLTSILATHPYFVVAELNNEIVGYQFNALDGQYGYLVRIAVHPDKNGQGIGARLMAEAIRFFKSAGSTRIMLNTQEENTHAHRLYEWFGFVRIPQIGFVLRRSL